MFPDKAIETSHLIQIGDQPQAISISYGRMAEWVLPVIEPEEVIFLETPTFEPPKLEEEPTAILVRPPPLHLTLMESVRVGYFTRLWNRLIQFLGRIFHGRQ